MKRNCLLLHRSSCFFAMIAIISCALLTISASTVSAQANASAAPGEPVSTADLDLGQQPTDWKSAVDYSTVVASERANAALILAAPTTKEPTISLYTGYDRMLAYMQADMIAGVPIEEIAINNFKKVRLESLTDPLLTNMEEAEFSAMYTALVGMLHQ